MQTKGKGHLQNHRATGRSAHSPLSFSFHLFQHDQQLLNTNHARNEALEEKKPQSLGESDIKAAKHKQITLRLLPKARRSKAGREGFLALEGAWPSLEGKLRFRKLRVKEGHYTQEVHQDQKARTTTEVYTSSG